MKQGNVLRTVSFKESVAIELEKIYPIQPLDSSKYEVVYYIDEEVQEIFLGSYYANRLKISSKSEQQVTLVLGEGYLSKESPCWTNRFITDDIWQGGDGIFSFNLDNGNDSFDQNQVHNTLLVFGDTFVGRFVRETEKRLEPHLMINNSLAYLKGESLEFKLNKGPMGNIKAFYEIGEAFDYKGPIPKNLVTYDFNTPLKGYLSAYNPETLGLVFDLHKERMITHCNVFNYFDEQSIELSKRGLKGITILGSHDSKEWTKIQDVTLDIARNKSDKQTIQLNVTYRYIKLTCQTINGIGNYNDSDYEEGLFGLEKIKFYNKTQLYRDIEATSNTVMEQSREHAWIWLQDGVVINKDLYFVPLVITGDQTQPEGLQFKVLGVSSFKTPIIDGVAKPELSTHKLAPIFAYSKESAYFYGAGMMANTVQAGSVDPDEYVYIYGYKTNLALRQLIVARVKAENFEYFDDWTYFNGETFTSDILDSKSILDHISCEMSVSPILNGKYKGKYIAVFTYDTDSRYVAFAIGDSPVGPFTKPQKVYKTKEKDIFKSTTYTYNAKAHPHLSNSKKILVSYNTNTYNFDHNMSNRLIYGPRFIYLNEIE